VAEQELDGTHHPVVVVGGGQAGLSMSWFLVRGGIEHVVLEGIEHVVLERERVATE
jgi:putative flavoprotein involved in K+ transport